MDGESYRERRRALLRDDPAAADRAARLLAEPGTEERDDTEIEAEHSAVLFAAVREYTGQGQELIPRPEH
ncbi:hypothetical protein AB0D74_04425 [Streptomyces sp. NPDC048278]|uniref:hypothetical protein n=1 Tax=Streptomyces sp. NPDC048278 TaxID=3155809 RepID=UPI0034488F30